MANSGEEADFEGATRILARAAAYLAMRHSDLNPDSSVLDRAKFLMRFGLTRAEAAELLGSSSNSIAELERQARVKKGTSNGKKKPSKIRK